ncbi:hypothetical protein RRG08_052434 [Elysia crispata]|uniref:Uncharacterized protein n=1 Tax=Elysia crispata TaxID=231223 RepID=A0AAE1E8W5_9GAST|nr:hypothetical protein RRG08_052434 [Elysia crispata]
MRGVQQCPEIPESPPLSQKTNSARLALAEQLLQPSRQNSSYLHLFVEIAPISVFRSPRVPEFNRQIRLENASRSKELHSNERGVVRCPPRLDLHWRGHRQNAPFVVLC